MTAPVQIASWAIAGLVAAWLLYTLGGNRPGPLGAGVDYVASVAGALLGGWLMSLATGGPFSPSAGGEQSLDQWWFTTPMAFVAAVLVDLIIRRAFRARHAP